MGVEQEGIPGPVGETVGHSTDCGSADWGDATSQSPSHPAVHRRHHLKEASVRFGKALLLEGAGGQGAAPRLGITNWGVGQRCSSCAGKLHIS